MLWSRSAREVVDVVHALLSHEGIRGVLSESLDRGIAVSAVVEAVYLGSAGRTV